MSQRYLVRVENLLGMSFCLPENSLTALIGRNGSGKTTLLRRLTGEIPSPQGEIYLGSDAKPLRKMSMQELSSKVAFLPQEHSFPGDLRLLDLMTYAYLPKMGWWGSLPPEAHEEIEKNLTRFRLLSLSHRRLNQLSTGERQRAFLARAILQQTEVLLLDEPTNHLDPTGTAEFWETLNEERKNRSIGSLISTHDLNFVKKHCQWILALEKGRLIFSGQSDLFWSGNFLERVYGRSDFISGL